MCSGMFEVYKNRKVLAICSIFVSQLHLEDDGSDAPRLLHVWHFLYDITAHTYDLSNVQLGNK